MLALVAVHAFLIGCGLCDLMIVSKKPDPPTCQVTREVSYQCLSCGESNVADISHTGC